MLTYMFCYFPCSSERFCCWMVCLACGQGNIWTFSFTSLLSSCSPCLSSELFHIISALKREDKIVSACDPLLANWEEYCQRLTPHFIPTWGMSYCFWLLPEADGKHSRSWDILKIFWTENANAIHNPCQWTLVSVNSPMNFQIPWFLSDNPVLAEVAVLSTFLQYSVPLIIVFCCLKYSNVKRELILEGRVILDSKQTNQKGMSAYIHILSQILS